MKIKLNKKKMIELDVQSHCNGGYPLGRSDCDIDCKICLDQNFEWHLNQIEKGKDLDYDCGELKKAYPQVRNFCKQQFGCHKCEEFLFKILTENPLKDIIKKVKKNEKFKRKV